MTLREYQDWIETVSTPRVNELGYIYASLGLAGESGEVIEHIKKIVRDNREPTDIEVNELTHELGDVLWYVGKLCNTLGIEMQHILDLNVQKINHRKVHGK